MSNAEPENATAAGTPPILEHRYLLVIPIPFYVDDAGGIWLERLWHHDFMAHVRYLRRLTLASPQRPLPKDRSKLVRVELPVDTEVQFAALPPHQSRLGAVLQLPQMVRALHRVVRDSDLVHSGVVGWPYPLGWIANPLTWLYHKKLIIVIESAPWRVAGTQGVSVTRKAGAAFTEWVARFCTNRADLGIFTSAAYRDTLMPKGAGVKVVAPATWINEEDVLSRTAAEDAWNKKPAALHVLFAGRLLVEKGVRVLLEAAAELERRGANISVDILGDGPLREECVSAASMHQNLRLLDPVPYGKPLFELVRGYHAVVVPSLSDEQPRIVFDAYSQAVPVIVSDTPGLGPCVEPGVTGQTVTPGSVSALVNALEQCALSLDQLRVMGLQTLDQATQATHRGMHERRWKILAEAFGPH